MAPAAAGRSPMLNRVQSDTDTSLERLSAGTHAEDKTLTCSWPWRTGISEAVMPGAAAAPQTPLLIPPHRMSMPSTKPVLAAYGTRSVGSCR